MRLLWVVANGLWPLNAGGRQRSFNIISELAKRNRVTLVTTVSDGDDPDGLRENLPDCERVISIPCSVPKIGSTAFALTLMRSWCSSYPVDVFKNRVPELRKQVDSILSTEKIDVCVADFLSTTPNVPLQGRVPVVLFQHNVEYVIWKRLKDIESKLWRRSLLELEWRKMRRHEARVCQQSALTLTVSDVDRDIIAAAAPGANICPIPTGVNTTYFRPNGTEENRTELVFTGSMDWFPNEDAILYFVNEIMPHIRVEVPNASLTVVGRNPTDRLKAVASEVGGMKITGTVDDIRPHVARAALSIVPLRIGGGTRIKIFEALAMGKAVVSTTLGAEGLPLTDREHFWCADNPQEFAQAVVFLLKNPDQRKTLGAAGRQLVEEHFSWTQVAREFERKCKEVISRNAN